MRGSYSDPFVYSYNAFIIRLLNCFEEYHPPDSTQIRFIECYNRIYLFNHISYTETLQKLVVYSLCFTNTHIQNILIEVTSITAFKLFVIVLLLIEFYTVQILF